jgi:hypothetical protein
MQQHNKLLNNRDSHQPSKVQNNLLNNNKIFSNNNMHAQQMQQMYQIKQNQNIVDKDKIKELIIQPIKLEKTNPALLAKTIKEKEEEYKPKLAEWWSKKTNVPYKGILKNENYNMKIKDEKDLIIHRVTAKDKDTKEIDNKYEEITDKIKSHNGELKVIYSSSKECEHKKKFNYTHVYQYRKPCLNEDEEEENDYEKIKKDRINYYKEQQKQQEKNKVKLDSVLEKLVNDGIFSADELNGFDGQKPNNDISNSQNKNTNNMDTNNNSSNYVASKKQMYLDRKKIKT